MNKQFFKNPIYYSWTITGENLVYEFMEYLRNSSQAVIKFYYKEIDLIWTQLSRQNLQNIAGHLSLNCENL